MKFSVLHLALVAFSSLICLTTSVIASPSSDFVPLGQVISGNNASVLAVNDNGEGPLYEFGSNVQISRDGKRSAVGAPPSKYGSDGSVAVFDCNNEGEWVEIFLLQGPTIAGDRFALSDDGQVLAVRHLNGDATVYRYKPDLQRFIKMGLKVTDPCTRPGRSLAVGHTTTDTSFGEGTWLLVGCELDRDLFTPHATTRNEEDPQALFGWQTAFWNPHKPGQPILIAVSAPNWNNKTGMVRVLQLDATRGSWQQLGEDLEGEAMDEGFGFALGISDSRGRPTLVVGAPRCSNGDLKLTGCVHVYDLEPSSSIGSYQWNHVDTMFGINPNDSLGRSVSVNGAGTRVVAASFNHERQRGILIIYERDSSSKLFQPIDELVGVEQFGQWGASVDMDESGSVVVSGSPFIKTPEGGLGTVQVFVQGGYQRSGASYDSGMIIGEGPGFLDDPANADPTSSNSTSSENPSNETTSVLKQQKLQPTLQGDNNTETITVGKLAIAGAFLSLIVICTAVLVKTIGGWSSSDTSTLPV